VFEAYSTGTASQGSEVQPGDRARISAGKIKLTVVPIIEAGVREALADAAMREIVDALTRSGRFQINPGDAIGVRLAEQGVKRNDILAGKGLDSVVEQFKVEQLLIVAFTRVQAKPYVDVRLFGAPGVTPRLSTALFVPPTVQADRAKGDFSAGNRKDQPAAPQRFVSGPAPLRDLDAGAYSSGESSITLKEVAKFPFVVVSMDVAVGSKDRIARLALTDGDRVYLYRNHRRARARARMDVPHRLEGARLQRSARRASQRRRPLRGGEPLPPDPGHPGQLADPDDEDSKAVVAVEDVNDILLAVDPAGDGARKSALGAIVRRERLLQAGDATRMTLSNGRLVNDGRVRVPAPSARPARRSSNISGKGRGRLAFIDENNRLRICARQRRHVSVLVPGRRRPHQARRGAASGAGRSDLYLFSEPMPLSVDLDGDGSRRSSCHRTSFRADWPSSYKGPGGYRFQAVNSASRAPWWPSAPLPETAIRPSSPRWLATRTSSIPRARRQSS